MFYRNSLILSSKFSCKNFRLKISFVQIFVQIKFVPKFMLFNSSQESNFVLFSCTKIFLQRKKRILTVSATCIMCNAAVYMTYVRIYITRGRFPLVAKNQCFSINAFLRANAQCVKCTHPVNDIVTNLPPPKL